MLEEQLNLKGFISKVLNMNNYAKTRINIQQYYKNKNF